MVCLLSFFSFSACAVDLPERKRLLSSADRRSARLLQRAARGSAWLRVRRLCVGDVRQRGAPTGHRPRLRPAALSIRIRSCRRLRHGSDTATTLKLLGLINYEQWDPMSIVTATRRPLNRRPRLRMTDRRSKSAGAGLAYAYRLYARSVCDTKAPLQLRYAACGAI